MFRSNWWCRIYFRGGSFETHWKDDTKPLNFRTCIYKIRSTCPFPLLTPTQSTSNNWIHLEGDCLLTNSDRIKQCFSPSQWATKDFKFRNYFTFQYFWALKREYKKLLMTLTLGKVVCSHTIFLPAGSSKKGIKGMVIYLLLCSSTASILPGKVVQQHDLRGKNPLVK